MSPFSASSLGHLVTAHINVPLDDYSESEPLAVDLPSESNDKSSAMACKPKKVQFGHIEFREYELELGDHPSVTVGPPISLSWSYNKEKCKAYNIDYFEQNRGPRRSTSQMVIPPEIREKWLIENGFSRRHITRAVLMSRETTRSMQIFSNLRKFDVVRAAQESSSRRMRLRCHFPLHA